MRIYERKGKIEFSYTLLEIYGFPIWSGIKSLLSFFFYFFFCAFCTSRFYDIENSIRINIDLIFITIIRYERNIVYN
ncbi:hypothetical protein PUN28_015630 [Cardiocondyla obscurior]|uniref:Uncharacterized protein n=1 Tax=Cardiocondyla obscurior TaxID=286306 RepID=A0AAW2EU38_9HYME